MLRSPLAARSGWPGRDRQTNTPTTGLPPVRGARPALGPEKLGLPPARGSSACPRPVEAGLLRRGREALAGPGQSSELAAPSPPGLDARPGPRSGEGGRQPSCKRRAG